MKYGEKSIIYIKIMDEKRNCNLYTAGYERSGEIRDHLLASKRPNLEARDGHDDTPQEAQ